MNQKKNTLRLLRPSIGNEGCSARIDQVSLAHFLILLFVFGIMSMSTLFLFSSIHELYKHKYTTNNCDHLAHSSSIVVVKVFPFLFPSQIQTIEITVAYTYLHVHLFTMLVYNPWKTPQMMMIICCPSMAFY